MRIRGFGLEFEAFTDKCIYLALGQCFRGPFSDVVAGLAASVVTAANL